MIYNLDIDGVVRDIYKPMKAIYKAHYDSNFDMAVNLEDYNFEKSFPLINSADRFLEKFAKAIFYESSPYPGSVDVVKELSKNNIINFISAQFKSYEYLTSLWLNNNGFKYDSLIFTKRKNLFEGDILVDDSIRNLEGCRRSIPICRSHSYNKKWKGLTINSLEELLDLKSFSLCNNSEYDSFGRNFFFFDSDKDLAFPK